MRSARIELSAPTITPFGSKLPPEQRLDFIGSLRLMNSGGLLILDNGLCKQGQMGPREVSTFEYPRLELLQVGGRDAGDARGSSQGQRRRKAGKKHAGGAAAAGISTAREGTRRWGTQQLRFARTGVRVTGQYASQGGAQPPGKPTRQTIRSSRWSRGSR